jgi:predicted DNA-binding transcriptional regulator AlpA
MTVAQLYKQHYSKTGDVSAAAMLTLAEVIEGEKAAKTIETDLLTIEQLAAMYQVNPRTIRRRVIDGTFPKPVKIGRSIRWNRADVELDLNHGKHL